MNDESFHHSRAHPWHGLDVGPAPPSLVHAYIEITPWDLVKYELDKRTGFMTVDRPQRTSSLPPTLYGFVPRTYCGVEVGRHMPGAQDGDGDPLDICVLSERPISRGDILLRVKVLGGVPMLDDGQADDKIVAVLVNDALWGEAQDIDDLPPALVRRLCHYFSHYKSDPGAPPNTMVGDPYGRSHAERVVEAAMRDYESSFSTYRAMSKD